MIRVQVLDRERQKTFIKEYPNIYQARLFMNKLRFSKKLKLISATADSISEQFELQLYKI